MVFWIKTHSTIRPTLAPIKETLEVYFKWVGGVGFTLPTRGETWQKCKWCRYRVLYLNAIKLRISLMKAIFLLKNARSCHIFIDGLGYKSLFLLKVTDRVPHTKWLKINSLDINLMALEYTWVQCVPYKERNHIRKNIETLINRHYWK